MKKWILGVVAALTLATGVAAAQSAGQVPAERFYKKSMNGSSQTLIPAATDHIRKGFTVLAVTTAGAVNAAAIVVTVSTQGGVTQTARSGANLNGKTLLGGAAWTDDASDGFVYSGAVTVIGTAPDGVQAWEW